MSDGKPPCPFCAETTASDGEVCRHCGRDLRDQAEPRLQGVAGRALVFLGTMVTLAWIGWAWLEMSAPRRAWPGVSTGVGLFIAGTVLLLAIRRRGARGRGGQ